MKEVEWYLTALAEEGAEVAQAADKAVKFGINEPEENIRFYTRDPEAGNNRDRLAFEVSDLVGVLEELDRLGVPEPLLALTNRARIDAKKIKLSFFFDYAKKQGVIDG